MCFWFVTEWHLNCQTLFRNICQWRQICSVICQNEASVVATSSKCKTAVHSFRLDWIILFDKDGQCTLIDIFSKNVNVLNSSVKLICISSPPVALVVRQRFGTTKPGHPKRVLHWQSILRKQLLSTRKKKAYSSEIEKQKHPQQVNSLNERVQFSILVAETPIAPIKLHLPDAETQKKKNLFHPASVRSVRPASVTSHGLGSEPESSL